MSKSANKIIHDKSLNLNDILADFSKNITSPNEKSALIDLIELLSINPIHELRNIPAEEILSEEEQKIYQSFGKIEEDPGRLDHTVVLIMKSTRLCNLRCVYCHSWRQGPNQTMKFPVLTRAIKDALSAKDVKKVIFVWHGGETMLMPIEFYKKALWLQQQFCREGQQVENAIQTNGTLISNEWLIFLKNYKFSIGVSLDGPPEVNDLRRIDKAKRPTTHLVEKGIKMLNEYQIANGILIVVDESIVELGPRRLLEYFIEIDVKNVALLNAIPENISFKEKDAKGIYIEWADYVEYLRSLFQIWWMEYKDKVGIRELDELVDLVQQNKEPGAGLCYFAGYCMGKYLTIEPTGEVNACDKYVGDKDYLFGNLLQVPKLSDLLTQSQVLNRAKKEANDGMKKMKNCEWFNVCHGGCPHDRRLNERYASDFTGSCCGLAPLIKDIKQAIQS